MLMRGGMLFKELAIMRGFDLYRDREKVCIDSSRLIFLNNCRTDDAESVVFLFCCKRFG